MRVVRIAVLAGFLLIGQAFSLDESEYDQLVDDMSTRPSRPRYGRFRGLDNEATIGKGDRFEGGDLLPLGAATGLEFDTILNIQEIHSAIAGLRDEYGIQVMNVPHESIEGRSGILGLVPCDPEYYPYATEVYCGEPKTYKVLITGGLNGRERSTPDSIIYFMADLLYAREHDNGLDYGNVTFTAEEVKRAASVGIVFYPAVNEDGLVYDHEEDQCWNRNRNNASMVEDIEWGNFTVGVDINRNFDFAFEYWRVLDPSVADEHNSNSSASERYQGQQAMSEQETKNINWTFESFPKLRWALDTHTYGGRVFFPWGTAVHQSNDTTKNWRNEEWDGQRGVLGPGTYREYMVEADNSLYRHVARRMADAMSLVNGTIVSSAAPGVLGPISGTLIDWAYARHIVDPSMEKVYAFSFEYNMMVPDLYEEEERTYCPFYPDKDRLNVGMREAAVTLMTFLLEVWERAV